jgi:hypothetical protein
LSATPPNSPRWFFAQAARAKPAGDTCAHAGFRVSLSLSVISTKLSNTQLLVLGFLLLAWLSLIAILAVAPEIYDQTLRLTSDQNARATELLFLGALSAFMVLIAVGVVRRWRWTFWLLLLAFLSGVLRAPASLLELAGWIPAAGPSWYVLFQALIGLVQLAIGLVLVSEYRRYGVWGHRPGRCGARQR